MTRTKLFTFATLLVAGAFSVGAPLLAHHSAAMFDPSKSTEVTGTVKELQWTNPHIWIQVNVDKAGAAGTKEEWSFEGGSPNSLSRSGLEEDQLRPRPEGDDPLQPDARRHARRPVRRREVRGRHDPAADGNKEDFNASSFHRRAVACC